MIDVEVKVDSDEIAKEIRRQTANQIRSLLLKIVDGTQKLCRDAFWKEIISRPEYLALFRTNPSPYGLGGQLGIADAAMATNPIVDAVVDALVVKPMTVRGQGRLTTEFGGIQVVFAPTNLWFLTDLPTASYKSNQYIIDWLGWLLFSGTEILVTDYRVKYGTGSVTSRTGDAVMVKSKKSGAGFRIHQTYAGRAEDNWITRAAAKAVPKIQKIIENAVKRAMQ